MAISNAGSNNIHNFIANELDPYPDDDPSDSELGDTLPSNTGEENSHLSDNDRVPLLKVAAESERGKMAVAHAVKTGLPVVDALPSVTSKATTSVDRHNPESASATKLKAASATGDDSSLASHGDKRTYWYSVGDGYRLLLAIRKTFTYTNEVISGEEYSAYRENRNRVFITDPYHIDNFDSCLEDDIKKIQGVHEITASKRQWTQLPRIIIIPILTGVHWRCLRLEMDYDHKKINILFDDPYGKNRFDETTKAKLKTSLFKNLDRLFISTTAIELEEQDKVINQQGVGNGYDCGPIVFCNIADYADVQKNNRMFSQGEGLRITSAEDTQHESLMIEIRASHMREYAKISGIKIDEARLDAIKKLMHAENQAKLATMHEHDKIDSRLHSQISQLPTAQISMIFNAVEDGIDIRDAYESIKVEYLGKSLFPLSARSAPLLQAFAKPFPSDSFSTSFPGGLVAPSATTQPVHTHPDHLNLYGKSLSLGELQQLCKEIQSNKLIGHITWGTLPSGEDAQRLRAQIELQIIQNNKAYRRYPTDFIYGILSKHAYEDAKAGDSVIFKAEELKIYNQYAKQWTVHSVHYFPDWGGYYGATYENKEMRQLVLAHRGTTVALRDLFKPETPLNTDIKGVLGGEIVRQHEAVYKVTQEAVKYAKENHYHFSTTGHSLGAWLAETCVYFSEFEFKQVARAVTFDSPGSITMSILDPNIFNRKNERDIRDLEIITYLSDPNLINTCNRHVGQVYRLYPDYKKLHEQNVWAKRLERLGQFAGVKLEGLWSVSGHSLAPLLTIFNPTSGKPIKFDKMLRWPVIKYTPPPVSGKNLLTDILNIPNKIVNGPANLLKPVKQAIRQSTIASVVNLLVDVHAGHMDQTQYLKCWEILSKPENIKAEKIVEGDQFSLTYEGSYEMSVIDPFIDQLISNNKGSADWHLKKLADCPLEKISPYFGQDNLITKQLITLKSLYSIDVKQGHYQILATDKSIEEMREHILRLLAVTGNEITHFLRTHIHTPVTFSPNIKLSSYLPPSLNYGYVFRGANIMQIDALLATHPYAIISGEPGFGKTTLATEYGHRQTAYPIVIKIDADSREKIDEEYKRIAMELEVPTEQQDPNMVRRLVNNRIANQQQKVLLIFDNVEKQAHIAPYVDYLPTNTKALVTTRYHGLLGESAPLIKIQPFTPSEARQYIEHSAIKNWIQNAQEVDALIAHYAKGSDTHCIAPYHLNKAIALIKANPLGNITDYLEKIRIHLHDEGELFLQQKLMAKSELAWPMLQYAAFLDPDAIDLEIFTQLFNVDKTALNEAIQVLESLSAMYIIRRNGQPFLSLHRLTQGIVKDLINKTVPQLDCMSRTDILLGLINSLNTLCPAIHNNSHSNWPKAKKLMPHIEYVLAQLPEKLPDTLNKSLIAELWFKSGGYAAEVLGLYHKAFYYHQKALFIRQQLYANKPHPDTAESLDNFGCIYYKLGEAENSKKGLYLLKQALAMREALYPNQPHADIAYSLNNVGNSYANLSGVENQKRGLELLKQALSMRQELYNQPHPDIAYSLNSVGIAYGKLGDLENRQRGLTFLEKALGMWQKLYDKPHLDIAYSLNSIGICYEALGGVENRQKSLSFLERALGMRQTLYGNQPHPDLASSLNSVGGFYKDLGGVENCKRGLVLQEQALVMRQALYGNQPHPDVANSFNNVGIAYEKLGGVENRQKGLDLQEKALVVRQALCRGQPHPDVANSFNNVGIAYEKLGGVENRQRGLALQEKALAMRQALYPDQPHPDVANSFNNIGIAYEKSGGVENRQKGLALREQALAMQKVLHADQPHPDVANSLNSIGLGYYKLGGVDNNKKSLALQEQALAMRKILHGDQPHRDVANSLNNVGMSYDALGGVDNIRKSLGFYKQALVMRQKLYGDQPHPEIAISLENIGIAYEKLGGRRNIKKGRVLQEKALAMRKKL